MKMGVKNIEEIIKASGTFGVLLIRRFKDGVQGGDIKGILQDPQFVEELDDAVDDGALAIQEAKDIDWLEGFGLARLVYDQGQRIINELKAPAPTPAPEAA